MVISKEALARIKQIISKYHKYLLVTMVGQKNVPPELLAELKRQGFDATNAKSFLELAYNHNFLNEGTSTEIPTSVEEMHGQQRPHLTPKAPANEASVDYLNSNLTELIDKQRSDVTSRIIGMIQAENNAFKFETMQDSDQHETIRRMLKEKSRSKIKQLLKDASGDPGRNWERIVATELSNAISLGSADRIVAKNQDVPADEVYVYRIVVDDAALCKYCRKFYQDDDGTPKLYRLSTILGNGTNYGKRAIDWKPVATATHPNERCSQLLELKRGWKLVPGGAQAYMGPEGWDEYIREKIVA